MARQYAIRDRDGGVRPELSRRDAFRNQRAYGGMIVARKDEGEWKPYKRRRIFLWVFLAVQLILIIWLIAGAATKTGPSASDIASLCGGNKWSPLYSSYQACVRDAGNLLNAAGNTGKGIGLALVVIIWVVVDFLLAVTYGIYRLARR